MTSLGGTIGPLHCFVLAAPCTEHWHEGHGFGLLYPGGRDMSQGLRWSWLLEAKRSAKTGH